MSITPNRWGNKVGLRIPKPMLEQIGLTDGPQVDVKIEAGRLVIEPGRRRRMMMAELLEGFTPDDRPGEVAWGAPAGREIW